MKRILLALCTFSLFGTSFVAASGYTVEVVSHIQQAHEEKTPVNVNTLPEAVKNVLSGNSYVGWLATIAFMVKGDDLAVYYEIELKKGEEITTLRLTQNGQPV